MPEAPEGWQGFFLFSPAARLFANCAKNISSIEPFIKPGKGTQNGNACQEGYLQILEYLSFKGIHFKSIRQKVESGVRRKA